MKKIFTSLALLAFSITGNAQTITQADHPVVGEVWLEFIDTTGGGLTIDPPGTGLSFNFTGLNIHDTDGVLFQAVSDAPGYMNAGTNFPGSGICVLNPADSSGTFFSSSTDGFYLDGIYSPGLISNQAVGLNIDAVELDPGRLLIPSPFAFQDIRTHNSNFTISFNPSGTPITVTVSSSYVQSMEADAEGTLTTPFGTFPGVLRFKEVTYTVDSTFYSAILNNTVEYSDTTITFTFVKQGPHAVLATVDVDPNTFTPIRASYYDPLSLVGEVEQRPAPVIYPNPANEQISISNVRENSQLEVYDYTGKLLKTFVATGLSRGLILHTSEWASGMYFIKLVQAGNVYSHQKFQVVR